MPLAKVVFAIPSIWQSWSRYRVQSWTPTSPSTMFEALWRLCESCFQKYMVRQWLLVQYVYIRRTSSYCKRSWKHKAQT